MGVDGRPIFAGFSRVGGGENIPCKITEYRRRHPSRPRGEFLFIFV
jgi:hypothetical protein